MDPFMQPNINFCEGKLQKNLVSNHIDEFVNTLSSLLFCVFSLIHWHKQDKRFLQLSTPIAMNFIVGLGSFLFHARGIRVFQFLDEIPMILTISSGILIFHEEIYLKNKLNKISYNFLQSLVSGLQASTIISNIYGKYFYIFEGLFMTFCIWVCSLVYLSCSKDNKKFANRTIITGFVGYGIWCIDQHYCNNITTWFHFHMWWHLLIGITIYNMMEIYRISVCERKKINYQSHLLCGLFIETKLLKNSSENL